MGLVEKASGLSAVGGLPVWVRDRGRETFLEIVCLVDAWITNENDLKLKLSTKAALRTFIEQEAEIIIPETSFRRFLKEREHDLKKSTGSTS